MFEATDNTIYLFFEIKMTENGDTLHDLIRGDFVIFIQENINLFQFLYLNVIFDCDICIFHHLFLKLY